MDTDQKWRKDRNGGETKKKEEVEAEERETRGRGKGYGGKMEKEGTNEYQDDRASSGKGREKAATPAPH